MIDLRTATYTFAREIYPFMGLLTKTNRVAVHAFYEGSEREALKLVDFEHMNNFGVDWVDEAHRQANGSLRSYLAHLDHPLFLAWPGSRFSESTCAS